MAKFIRYTLGPKDATKIQHGADPVRSAHAGFHMPTSLKSTLQVDFLTIVYGEINQAHK